MSGLLHPRGKEFDESGCEHVESITKVPKHLSLLQHDFGLSTDRGRHRIADRHSLRLPGSRLVVDLREKPAEAGTRALGAAFDTTFDVWSNVAIVMPAATTGNSAYGILFQRCDSITFRDVHIAINPGLTGTVYPLVFNYTPYAAWPSDNIIESITIADPTLYTAPAANSGTPSGATPNRVMGFRTWHPSSPGLANLSWGYTAANP